eukprot:m.233049 g.233049  ORF g.233049 m.233049 type:complete len:270 (-) comp18958_c0_seq1:44-853(-)
MAYEAARGGALKIKGLKLKKNKRKSEKSEEEAAKQALRYGVWWLVKADEQLLGTVFFETEHGGFLSASDDGTLGQLPPPEARERAGDDEDEALHPSPEDLFSVVRVSDNRVAIKTAFGRYVSCDDHGTLTARQEAMGPRELWQPMWRDQENGALVLRSAGKGYLTSEPKAGVKARAEVQTLEEATQLRVWSCAEQGKKKAKAEEMIEDKKGNLHEVEEDYAKRFQSFQGGRVQLSKDAVRELKSAKKEGNLHEALLDRREKMKADRYCK